MLDVLLTDPTTHETWYVVVVGKRSTWWSLHRLLGETVLSSVCGLWVCVCMVIAFFFLFLCVCV